MPSPTIPETHLTGPPNPERKYRLVEIVRRRARELRYSRRTAEAYVRWIVRYVRYHDRRHPAELSAEHVRSFLSISPSTTAQVAVRLSASLPERRFRATVSPIPSRVD
jgi:hypothetical protein